VSKLADSALGAWFILPIFALLAACGSAPGATGAVGDPSAGRIVITREACGSCHTIPGIELANGLVGPPLAHFASQRTVAGMLPNSGAALAAFLRSPQAVVKGGAMPDMGLTERDARDAAAYLLMLK
jgi:cytochrome c2